MYPAYIGQFEIKKILFQDKNLKLKGSALLIFINFNAISDVSTLSQISFPVIEFFVV